jgi:hypothetical protein
VDEPEHRHHVVSNRVIDGPEIHRIPSAVFRGVVPREQKISDLPGLAALLQGDEEQPL